MTGYVIEQIYAKFLELTFWELTFWELTFWEEPKQIVDRCSNI